LCLNTRVLPEGLRPPMWRGVALVCTVFYAFFVTLVVRSLIQCADGRRLNASG
jgi:hypothetical protein